MLRDIARQTRDSIIARRRLFSGLARSGRVTRRDNEMSGKCTRAK